MKKLLFILFAAPLVLSCKQDSIKTYSVENSAINFNSTRNAISLIGVTDEKVELLVPVTLVGPVTDYDREITLSVEDSTAHLGSDFRIVSSVLKAGEYKGIITLEVDKLPEDVTSRAATLSIVPNEHFIAGVPRYQKCIVAWSEEYARPAVSVWHAWFLFFSKSYSKDFHKVLVEVFGPEIDTYVYKKSEAQDDPSKVFKMTDWWYAANARLYEYVSTYDKAHPDAPLMHSADYELYSSYLQPVGEGEHSDNPPTILSTLNSI